MLPRWWKKNHWVLPSVHHPLTPMIYKGLRNRTHRRIFTQAPQLILWSHKSLPNGFLFRLAYSFQPPIKDLCILGSLQRNQISHLGFCDSYFSAIFHGFPSLTNPPKLVSVVLESLFSSCPAFYHLPLLSCCQWLWANGKTTGWNERIGEWYVEGRSWVQWYMKLTLTTQTNAKLQLWWKLGRNSLWCYGGAWEDFLKDFQQTWSTNKG